MVLAECEGQVIFPKTEQAVGFLFPVLINAEINFRSFGVNIAGDFAGRIKCFGIGKIVYQLGKIPGHFIRVLRGQVLILQPAVFVLFYKQGFPQFIMFGS